MDKVLTTDPNISYHSNHKLLGIFGIFWVSFLILTMFTAIKTFTIFGMVFSVAMIAYPVTYIFSDIFTEVYGYKVTRKIVWSGFSSIFVISLFAYVYAVIPASPDFTGNDAFNLIFRAAPIIVLAQMCAFFFGELANSFVLAKIKIATNGKIPEMRYILSTFFGQVVDNTIAVTGIYYAAGFFSSDTFISIIVSSVILCVLIETCMIPVTRIVIKKIKEIEGLDTYDIGTDFNPFRVR